MFGTRQGLVFALGLTLSLQPALACTGSSNPNPEQIVDIRRVMAPDDNVYLVEVERYNIGIPSDECDGRVEQGTCLSWEELRSLPADDLLLQWNWREEEQRTRRASVPIHVMHVVETINGEPHSSFLGPRNRLQDAYTGRQFDHHGHTGARFWTGAPDGHVGRIRSEVGWGLSGLAFAEEGQGYANELYFIASCTGPRRVAIFSHGDRFVFFADYWNYFRGSERIVQEDDRWLEYVRERYAHLRRGDDHEYDPNYPTNAEYMESIMARVNYSNVTSENPVTIISADDLRATGLTRRARRPLQTERMIMLRYRGG